MKTKKLLSLLLVFALTLSVIGCSGSGSAGSGSSAESSANDGGSDSEERVPIYWLTTGDAAAEVIKDDDRIIEYIDDLLGIDLTVEIVPESSTEKVNVAMASGEFPDIVTGEYGSSATQEWIEDSLVIVIDDYISEYPDLQEWFEDYEWTDYEGSYYGIPFITQLNAANTLICMRQDWLDNMGVSYPATTDEFKDLMMAFTYEDPDGDGVDNTFGYTSDDIIMMWVFFAFGLEYGDYALDENDNVIPWFEDDSFIPAMTYIKDLWDSGVIDPELMLNDSTKKEEKFYQGKAGSMLAAMYRHVDRIESNLQELYPEATITYGLGPAGPDGSRGITAQGKSGFLNCITSACENPDKAMEFMVFMISDEGKDLLRLGIEGIHYTMDGDTIIYNEEERAKDAFTSDGWSHALAWGSFFWPLDENYLPDTAAQKERAEESVELATQCQVPNLIKQKMSSETEYSSIVDDIFTQYYSDMLQGKIGIEEGVEKLSAEWRSQGGDIILEEANEVYHSSK